MDKQKLKKGLTISAVSLLTLYLLGGISSTLILDYSIFRNTSSTIEDLNNKTNRYFFSRNDYPNLANVEEHFFKSGDNVLRGYMHRTNKASNGLVLYAHGLTSQANSGGHLVLQNWLVSEGYDVFAIDLTASGASEGDSTIGLYQSAFDIYEAYNYLQNNNLLEDKLILLGHSWGGFGVSASLSLGVKAQYVITFAAFDNPLDTMNEFASHYIGPLSFVNYPVFAATYYSKTSGKVTMSASDSIRNSDAKVLVFHGEDDNRIPIQSVSLFGHLSNSSQVKKVAIPNCGHSWLWLTESARDYIKQLDQKYETLSDEQKEDFFASIDKTKTAEIDEKIASDIKNFLNS